MPTLQPSNGDFGRRMCEILGLPKATRGFELRCYCDELVSVKCEYYPTKKQCEQLAIFFQEYELHQLHLIPAFIFTIVKDEDVYGLETCDV